MSGALHRERVCRVAHFHDIHRRLDVACKQRAHDIGGALEIVFAVLVANDDDSRRRTDEDLTVVVAVVDRRAVCITTVDVNIASRHVRETTAPTNHAQVTASDRPEVTSACASANRFACSSADAGVAVGRRGCSTICVVNSFTYLSRSAVCAVRISVARSCLRVADSVARLELFLPARCRVDGARCHVCRNARVACLGGLAAQIQRHRLALRCRRTNVIRSLAAVTQADIVLE